MVERPDRELLAEAVVESVRDIGQMLQNLSDESWLSVFATSYSRVLRRAEEISDEIAGRLSSLIAGFQSGVISPEIALQGYVDAMSFEFDGQKVFLPSYSDTCFRDLTKASLLRLSPFRGIYFSWRLAEISKEFASGQFASGSKNLDALHDELAIDHAIQSFSSVRYRDYYELLGRLSDLGPRRRHLDVVDRLQVDALRSHIVCFKQAFLSVTAEAKKRWVLRLPYPILTSTHFYLSGMRFFWNPVLERNFDPDGARYYVQSRNSGLIIPKERYGMLLPDGDNDSAANELINAIPPGRLAVDMGVMGRATNRT